MSFLLKKDEPCEKQTSLQNAMNNLNLDSEKFSLFLNSIIMEEEDQSISNDENTDKKCVLDERKDSLEPCEAEKILKHESNSFRVSCGCTNCLVYRSAIIELFFEDFEYNTLWERLQLLIRKFYDIIPEDNTTSMDKRYKSLMNKHATKWISDGRIDTNKSIQISLGSNLPLSNEMTFILVFSMLYTRDPHQLFELLCIQLRSIVIAYSEGLKELVKGKDNAEYDPSELLNFILDGYDKICNSAKSLSPLLFELQRGHLQQFSLTWNLLNRRMYQRWVYFEVQKLIPECILKLKELVYSEKYKSTVFRYIKFDDEMTITSQMWRDVWSLLHDYHLSKEELERRQRISSVNSILSAIKCSKMKDIIDSVIGDSMSISEFMSLDHRDPKVWKYIVYFLKNKWIDSSQERICIDTTNIQCRKCKVSLSNHFIDCTCRTCLIAGGPCQSKIKESLRQLYCTKCSYLSKYDREYLDYISDIINERITIKNDITDKTAVNNNNNNTKNDIDDNVTTDSKKNYHLAWAIFKHMPDIVPYKDTVLDATNFCIFKNPPCTRTCCRIAIHIIAAIFPYKISKFLVKSYQPLHDNRKTTLMSIRKLDFTYLHQKLYDNIKNSVRSEDIDRYHPLNAIDLLWASSNVDMELLSDMGSAFAESYLINFQFPNDIKIYPSFLSLFKFNDTNSDIELDLDRLECIYASRSIVKISNPDKITEIIKTNRIAEINDAFDRLKITNTKINKEKDKWVVSTSPTSSSSSSSSDGGSTSSSSDGDFDIEQCSRTPKKNATNVDFNEAIKFVVNTKMNNKLEAELRSLKKEHSVLKDMVRDLEQIKEYEEKLNHKSSNHQCCSDHPDQSPENCSKDQNSASKICHRSEGQCECNHGRNNETRDRLRKRLHQIHSNKDAPKPINFKNLKTQSVLFKKITSGKTNNNNINNNTKEISVTKKTVYIQQSSSSIDKNETAKLKIVKPIIQKIIKPLPKTSTSPEIIVEKIVENKPKVLPKKIEEPPVQQSAQRSAPILLPPPPPPRKDSDIALSSVKDILQFIEGTPTLNNKTKDCEKKAAKKAKQKLKKEEEKKTQQLDSLKNIFQELCLKENDINKELKLLKSVRRKDKKKISDTELKMKALENHRNKKENSIKNLISSIKKTNPNFEYTYYLNEAQLKKANEIKTREQISSSETTQILETNEQFVPLMHANGMTNQQQPQQNCEISLDPSKRMVTIRRINLPHSEPQVTVTAKGASPDKDQLLYTFINGQLVPASSVGKARIQNLQPAPTPNFHQHLKEQQFTAKSLINDLEKVKDLPKNNLKKGKLNKKQLNTNKSSDEKNKNKVMFVQQQSMQQAQQQQNKKKEIKQTIINKNIVKELKTNTKINKNKKSEIPQNVLQKNIANNKIVKESVPKQLTASNSKESSIKNNNKAKPIKIEESSKVNKKTNQNKNKKTDKIEEKFMREMEERMSILDLKSKKKEKRKERKLEKIELQKESQAPKVIIPLKIPAIIVEKKIATKKICTYIDPEFRNNKYELLDMDDYSESDNESIIIEEKPITKKVINKQITLLTANNTKTKNNSNNNNNKNNNDNNNNKNKNNKLNELSLPQSTVKSKENKVKTKLVAENVAAGTKSLRNTANNVSSKKISKSVQQNSIKETIKLVKTVTQNNNNNNNSNVSSSTSKKVPLTKNIEPPPVVLTKKQKKKLNQKMMTEKKNMADSVNHNVNVKGKQTIDKTVMNAENMAKSLNDSMQRLHLNADTTIELVKEYEKLQMDLNQGNSNVSIMEQLKRGVRVEGLTLPPGITLTRVDPVTADSVKAKKESIGKICKPLQQQVQEPQINPHLIVGNPMISQNTMHSSMPIVGMGQDPGGVIMIDTLNIGKNLTKLPLLSDNEKKSKKKNKKKTQSGKVQEINSIINVVKDNKNSKNKKDKQSKMVTLRNPMFHAVSDAILHQQPPTNNSGITSSQRQQQHQQQQQPVNVDQPAAIIKNENGMFTIRNPALHQAIQAGVVSNVRQYSPNVYSPNDLTSVTTSSAPPPLSNENFSYFSDSILTNDSSGNNSTIIGKKYHSAIGSEMKNAQQQKQQWNGQLNQSPQQQQQQQPTQQQQQQPTQQQQLPSTSSSSSQNGDMFNHMQYSGQSSVRSYSPFDSQQSVYGFNSDFIGSSPTQLRKNIGTSYRQPITNACFNNFPNSSLVENGSLFSVNNLCNDSHTSSLTTPLINQQQQKYYDNGTNGCIINKYDDNTFLKNLQPGQRLNSEVTIHNISESKFLRAQQNSQMPNGVEITKIHGPPSVNTPTPSTSTTAASLAVGSNRTKHTNNNNMPNGQQHHHNSHQQHHSHHQHHLQNINQQKQHPPPLLHNQQQQKSNDTLTEYGESIFAPNQTVNLSELESEERDIESFKRFNYYFEPPKNKPKVNINVKDIVVTKKQGGTPPPTTSSTPTTTIVNKQIISECSSPYLKDNNSTSIDDLYNEISTNQSTKSEPILDHAQRKYFQHNNNNNNNNNSNISLSQHGVIGSEIKILHGNFG